MVQVLTEKSMNLNDLLIQEDVPRCKINSAELLVFVKFHTQPTDLFITDMKSTITLLNFTRFEAIANQERNLRFSYLVPIVLVTNSVTFILWKILSYMAYPLVLCQFRRVKKVLMISRYTNI
jgi:hypothetical protein